MNALVDAVAIVTLSANRSIRQMSWRTGCQRTDLSA